MAEFINVEGQTFNYLTAISYHRETSKVAYWKCVCICGNTTMARLSDLRTGRKISCGCGHERNRSLIGQTFGRLTVLEKAVGGNKHYVNYLCICICGNTKVVKSKRLVGGETKSCGCLHDEMVGTTDESKRMIKVKGIIDNYKYNSTKRNHSYELSDEEAIKLLTGNCHYCGVEPLHYHNKDVNKIFPYNGIDRKNSYEGYNINNCVSCCRTCNYLKNSMSYDRFLDVIMTIYRHLNLETHQLSEVPYLSSSHTLCNYKCPPKEPGPIPL